MEYRIVLGVLATIIALVSYVPYFRDILAGRTKPHAFSWFVWAVLTGVAFSAQVVEGAGPGAWVTGFTALVCVTISVLALRVGKRSFPLFDWLCLLSSLVALVLWWVTSDPLLSVILITVTDVVAFLPTFRKAWFKPREETAITYLLSGVKFLIALFALEVLVVETWLYPASLVLMNGSFVVLLVVRRRLT